MSYGLTIVSWDGHTEICRGGLAPDFDYNADFVEDSKTLDTPTGQAIEATRPGRSPVHAFVQPDGVRFGVEIVIQVLSQANLDRLKQWFDPTTGEEKYLVATSGTPDTRRLLCVVEGLALRGPTETGTTIFRATLRAATGIWESNSAPATIEEEITVSGGTVEVDNAGSTRQPLTIRLLPAAQLSDADGPTWFRRILIANRAEGALNDWACETYPVDVTGGGINTTALESGGKLLTNMDDLLVWHNGEFIARWLSSASLGTAVRVFANIHFQPGKFATLAAAIDAGANELTVDNPEAFDGWPEDGFFFIENEPVQYHLTDPFTATLTRNAPTSHAAAASIKWIEHTHLFLVYGWSAAPTPNTDADREPRIDLAQSTNLLHAWTSVEGFFNTTQRRSRSWRPTLSDKGVTGHIRSYDDSGAVLEDLAPEAGKPPYAEMEMILPVAAAGPILIDYSIGDSLHFRGRVIDLGGHESELISELRTAAPVVADEFTMENPINKLRLLGRIAAVVGELDNAVASLSMSPSTITRSFPTAITPTGLSSGTTFVGVPGEGGEGGSVGTFGGTTSFAATIDASDDLEAELHQAVHFGLSEETTIDNFLAEFTSDLDATPISSSLYSGTNVAPDRLICGATFPAASGIRMSDLFQPITVPAGEYWLIFEKYSPGSLRAAARSKAGIYAGNMIVPTEPLTPSTIVPGGSRLYLGYDMISQIPGVELVNESFTPIFAVLSKTTDPQPDAPTQTGFQIIVDNVIVPLDASRAPQVLVEAERALGYLVGQLKNEETNDYVDTSFLSALDEGLELNTETGEVTDTELGLPVGFATSYGNPDTKLYAQPAVQDLSWTQAGVTSLNVEIDRRHPFL